LAPKKAQTANNNATEDVKALPELHKSPLQPQVCIFTEGAFIVSRSKHPSKCTAKPVIKNDESNLFQFFKIK
jgi:hypothetical protein